jgi:hypothetical protein
MSGNILDADKYFELSDSYYKLYFKLNDEIDIAAHGYTEDQLSELSAHSDQMLSIAREYRARFNKSIITDIKTSAEHVNESVKEAIEAIHDLKVVGTVVDVIGDLVIIGGTILAAVTSPAEIGKLPGLINNLIKDVKEVKTA